MTYPEGQVKAIQVKTGRKWEEVQSRQGEQHVQNMEAYYRHPLTAFFEK